VRHVHGPPAVSYAPDELLVVTVVRNGEFYIESFMEHYRSLGARHLVFLDNGSTDRTVDMLCRYDHVTVLRTDAPYDKYENIMKLYLVRRFSRQRWNLCVDIDELFDYPFSATLTLQNLLRYLNAKNYNAVLAQMLDLFADAPLTRLESNVRTRLSEVYRYYDLSAIRKTEYSWSEPDNERIKWHWDGIRKTMFGTGNSLTKAALVRLDQGVKTFVGWHHVENARVADISCLLKHYPIVPSFREKVEEAVRTGRYGMKTTNEYVGYWRVLEGNPDLNLRSESARLLEGTEDLIDEGFLVVSEDYRRWVAMHGGDKPGTAGAADDR
jgi:hypothetical protein